MEKVAQSLAKFLGQAELKAWGPRAVLAVSGGADSVALLLAAARLRLPGWQFSVLHCQHGLRGEASKRDEGFVRALCARLGLPCVIERTRLGKGPGVETRARDWRRRCYASAAKAFGARLVLLAQHEDDQAETLLLNLLRGAGLRGAGAMAPLAPLGGVTGVQLGRPFLALSPLSLRAYLRGLKQAWREDASNKRADNPRNLLRLKVLPLLRRLRPDASARLADFAALARADEARLNEDAGAMDPRVLRAWVEKLKPRPMFDQRLAKRLRDLLAKGHGSVSLGAGWLATCSVGKLHASRVLSPLATAGSKRSKRTLSSQALVSGKALRWGAWQFRLQRVTRPKSLRAKDRYYFDPAAAKAGLRIAAPKRGARLQPFGMTGTRKVLDLLRDVGVPVWQRGTWPLLFERSGRILGILGVRQGQAFAVAGNCRRVLCVSWKRLESEASSPP